MVNLNGEAWFQFGRTATFTRRGANLAQATAFNTRQHPAQASTIRITSVGFFPSWRLILTRTTNNQVTLPVDVNFLQKEIKNATGFDKFDDDDVLDYGPPVWDAANSVHYLYVKLLNNTFWFCKMDTDFEIIEASPVSADDAILFGPIGLLDL